MELFVYPRAPRPAPSLNRGRSALRAFRAAGPFFLAIALAACAGTPVSAVPTIEPTPTPIATVSPTPAPTAAFPVTITDDEGATVAVATEPRRIVSLTPAATETLFAIGAGDRVVAKVEDITPYPPEADGLPVVATYKGVDIEQIVNLQADLVVAGGLGFTPPAAVTQLRNLGIPVIVLYAESVAGALAGIETIGRATGAFDAAQTLTKAMQGEVDRLAGLTAGLPRPRTFYEIDATSDIYTVPAGSLYEEMLRLAGSDPITTDSSYQISLEKLIVANPEVILLGDGGYTTPADVAARPNWAGIAAVANGQVVPVDDTLITRPGPRLVDGLRALIAALHPEVRL
ncbi:MAG: ABC transporter substrate-binding protein [Chloroflexi bacterium]|nr:ABC transporter substrate-binding protein [Chloroflexota bacterium]